MTKKRDSAVSTVECCSWLSFPAPLQNSNKSLQVTNQSRQLLHQYKWHNNENIPHQSLAYVKEVIAITKEILPR